MAFSIQWHKGLGMPARVDRDAEIARELAEDARTDPLVPVTCP